MRLRAIAYAVGGVAAVMLLGGGALFGPELYNGYRLEKALDQQFEAAQADGGPWPQFARSCYGCHGPQGRSANAQYPALAGLPAHYLESQLRAFAGGQRHSPFMGPLARNLRDEHIKTLATYYARQTPHQNESVPSDAALGAKGLATARARGCVACHGEGLKGKDLAPRLAGQGEAYLAQQLTAFKTGQRRDATGAMSSVAANLPDDEVLAMARYLASLSP